MVFKDGCSFNHVHGPHTVLLNRTAMLNDADVMPQYATCYGKDETGVTPKSPWTLDKLALTAIVLASIAIFVGIVALFTDQVLGS